jgi:hypothetical protein
VIVRALSTFALLTLAASASAQGTKPPATKAPAAKSPATKAPVKAPATKAPVTKAAATKAPATKSAPPATNTATLTAKTQGAATKAATQTGTKAGRPVLTVAPEAAPIARLPVVMREVFSYDPGGRRDPFVSLLSTSDLRPTITDLKLVGILYDESGRRPVAIMREFGTNTQYRVTTGMTLGRMRVTSIQRRKVIFTIEEFGLNRMDTLVLGDTTKLRIR